MTVDIPNRRVRMIVCRRYNTLANPLATEVSLADAKAEAPAIAGSQAAFVWRRRFIWRRFGWMRCLRRRAWGSRMWRLALLCRIGSWNRSEFGWLHRWSCFEYQSVNAREFARELTKTPNSQSSAVFLKTIPSMGEAIRRDNDEKYCFFRGFLPIGKM